LAGIKAARIEKNMTNVRPVLYVEDDENDAFFMERAFKLADVRNLLCIVNHGHAAIEYLSGAGPPDRLPPCLILLDLKMPLLSGLDVLDWVRSTASTNTIPVVMFTSSNQKSDLSEAYLRGANGYLIKPGKPAELLTMVKAIKEFWLDHNQIPGSTEPRSNPL
jgi:CheY-like chemotaxis protein